MSLFRTAPRQDPLIVSITGVQIGHRILGLVGDDARLFLEAAGRVGITGSAFALAPDAAAVARVQEAALKHGVLVDTGPMAMPLPLPDASFDLALLDDRTAHAGARTTSRALLADVRRVLRPGGRIILAIAAPASALAGLFGFTPKAPDVTALLQSLQDAGFIAARLLASREGVGYVEAARPTATGPGSIRRDDPRRRGL